MAKIGSIRQPPGEKLPIFRKQGDGLAPLGGRV